ncbi:hypothetical protein CTAYLR_005056 [Chrysophaeum taylorii]|uniref:RAP domain-containing protein n=1 Tax=Chrysophaeum taylorii TaxID=2483200 RepID=A0AAD7UAB6_9STRA|nr:hypothetical protein CTAYLR_005056 [Chrysophaeum taylorii]
MITIVVLWLRVCAGLSAWQAGEGPSRALQRELSRETCVKRSTEMLWERRHEANEINVCALLYRAASSPPRELLAAAREVVPQMKSRQLANTARALALCATKHDGRAETAEMVLRRIGEDAKSWGRPEELAMASWAAARFMREEDGNLTGVARVALWALVARAAAAFDAGKSPKEAANVAWAIATAASGPLADREREAAVAFFGSLNKKSIAPARDVATIVWSCAKLSKTDWRVSTQALGAIEGVLARLDTRAFFETATVRDVSQTLSALATASFDAPDFFRRAHAFAGSTTKDNLALSDAAVMLWASALLDRPPDISVFARLLAPLAAAAAETPPPLEVSLVVWSAAVLAHASPAHAAAAADLVCGARFDNLAEREDLRRLHQALLALRVELDAEAFRRLERHVPAIVRARARRAWRRAEDDRHQGSSARHRAVADTLASLKTQHEVVATVRDEYGDLYVDMLVKKPDPSALVVALEFDGPSHFCANDPRRPLGHTMLKRRLLEARGFDVVSVPYLDWDRIPFWSSMERQRYLQRKLRITETLRYQGGDNARSEGLDFLVVPLVHPRLSRDVLGISDRRTRPMTRSDLVLSSGEWSRLVVGRVSMWPWRSIGGARRAAAAAAVRRELEWAGHLGLSAVVADVLRRSTTSAARLVNQVLQRAASWQLWVQCKLGGGKEEDDDDSWEKWDELRRLCDHSLALCVALEIGIEPPSRDAARRWRGEPIKAVFVPAEVFVFNEAGFPVLPKSHQALLSSLAALAEPRETRFVLSGRPRHARGRVVYAQYLNHLLTTRREPLTQVEELELPYRDYLQAPLQPLADDLEAQTYETFERDPVKYERYQTAIERFLADWRGTDPPVIAVLGAGRGPLVRCALAAARAASVDLRRVYAVEKNANALVTLRALAHQLDDWRGVVAILAGDMRDVEIDDLADCVVSELLGSFGDNELSPECLDGARHLAKLTHVSIPRRYESFAAPIAAARLWYDARRANTGNLPGPPPALVLPGAPPPARGLETPFVVKLHRFAPLADSQSCFLFEHPNPNYRDADTNSRSVSLEFFAAVDATVHGLAGYFEACLYDDISISINPPTFSTGMFSWFPLFIPFLHPVKLKAREPLRVDLWRVADASRVWYEWAVLSPVVLPIQNPNGRSYAMRLQP